MISAARKRPPSRAKSWYEKFFEILSSRKIDLVDSDFVSVNITPDRGDVARFIAGLKFLGLIGTNGKATEKLEKLRLTGDEFKVNLSEIIKEAYSDVFDKVDLTTVKRENLVNFFIGKYQLAGTAAGSSVDILVYFADKAGIPLSDELKSSPTLKTQRSELPRKAVERAKTSPRKEETDNPPEGMIVLQFDKVKIWLPKDDRNAAETAKDLIDLHIKRNFLNQ